MRTLPLPPLVPASVLSACIGGVNDPMLAMRLNGIASKLTATAGHYDQQARAKSLQTIARVDNVDAVTATELKSLYSDHMSATSGAARPFYNAIRNAPANAKCPLCGIGTVTVLDHHLPKSKYPDLSVCPFNLVPACDFCNNAKKAKYPMNAGEQTIHPYYDDFTGEQWIYALLDISGPPVLVYFADPPSTWSSVDQARVRRHFDVVKLGISYISNANDELIPLRGHLATIRSKKGSAGVQAYLADERERHACRINSWQHVMYQTLAADAWFTGGGFLHIPT